MIELELWHVLGLLAVGGVIGVIAFLMLGLFLDRY